MIIPIAFCYCFAIANAPDDETWGVDGFVIFNDIIFSFYNLAVLYFLVFLKPWWLNSFTMTFFSIVACILAKERKSSHGQAIAMVMFVLSFLHALYCFCFVYSGL